MSGRSNAIREAIEEAVKKVEDEGYRNGFIDGYRKCAQTFESLFSDVSMWLALDLEEAGLEPLAAPGAPIEVAAAPEPVAEDAGLKPDPAPEIRPPAPAENPQSPAPLPPPVDEKPPAVEKSSTLQSPTPAALIAAHSVGPTWKTPERQAVMVKLYPTAETMAEVDNAINALDGGKVQRSWLYTWANELKLRRPPPPAGGYPQKKKSVPAPPNGKGPVSADFEQIEQWSAIRGIDFARDGIEVVNKKRSDLGLPPFALRHAGARP